MQHSITMDSQYSPMQRIAVQKKCLAQIKHFIAAAEDGSDAKFMIFNKIHWNFGDH